eukprot:6177025-Pleurochrysis_carterae.AAC.5
MGDSRVEHAPACEPLWRGRPFRTTCGRCDEIAAATSSMSKMNVQPCAASPACSHTVLRAADFPSGGDGRLH